MAAEILKLPEEAFVARFRQLLGACPVVRADDYTGASVRRSEAKLCAVRAARARKDVEGAAALAASRENTAALERAAKEARREREAAAASASRRERVGATNINNSSSSSSSGRGRVALVKSDAAAEAEVAVKAYYKRMRAHLNGSPSFTPQQVEAVVQRFKFLTTTYLSQLSLEDIDEIGRKSLAE